VSTNAEPRNPFFTLLMIASVMFVITALAYAVIPTLQDRAADAGAVVPESAFRDALKRNGGRWLLYEVAAMIVLGVTSMLVDRHRLRRLQNASAAATMLPQLPVENPSPPLRESHEDPRSARPGTEEGHQLP
jgi:hypothetical protein